VYNRSNLPQMRTEAQSFSTNILTIWFNWRGCGLRTPGSGTHEWLSENTSSHSCGGNRDFSHRKTMSADDQQPVFAETRVTSNCELREFPEIVQSKEEKK
jgi:hypothetical protein